MHTSAIYTIDLPKKQLPIVKTVGGVTVQLGYPFGSHPPLLFSPFQQDFSFGKPSSKSYIVLWDTITLHQKQFYCLPETVKSFSKEMILHTYLHVYDQNSKSQTSQDIYVWCTLKYFMIFYVWKKPVSLHLVHSILDRYIFYSPLTKWTC